MSGRLAATLALAVGFAMISTMFELSRKFFDHLGSFYLIGFRPDREVLIVVFFVATFHLLLIFDFPASLQLVRLSFLSTVQSRTLMDGSEVHTFWRQSLHLTCDQDGDDEKRI